MVEAVAIVLAVAAVYATSVSGPFILDDYAAIVNNPSIRQLWNLPRLLVPPPELPVSGRPMANVSFALTYAMNGLQPWAYHLWNIGLHACCALVLLGIVRRTMETPVDPHAPRWPRGAAFAAALVWAVHPLNSDAVDYLTQRTELLVGLFFLLTLYCSVRALAAARPQRWETLAVIACALGMGSKESMVSAPLIVVLYDRMFLFESFSGDHERGARTPAWRPRGWSSRPASGPALARGRPDSRPASRRAPISRIRR